MFGRCWSKCQALIITVLEGRYFEGFWLENNELVSQGVECGVSIQKVHDNTLASLVQLFFFTLNITMKK